MKPTLLEKHIQLIELVNNSKTEGEHYSALQRLYGFRDALDVIGVQQGISCDLHYIDKGIDRPMCCGVFLDWEPAQ